MQYLIDTPLRRGVAMIELIFALVIMGITMLSAPLLISQSTNSNLASLQQESISILASHASALMSYAWDEQNTLKPTTDFTNNILTVSSIADSELNSANRVLPGRRKFNVNPLAKASTILGKDINLTANETEDDIDDFADANQTLIIASQVSGTAGEGEYIDTQVHITTKVNYMDDKTDYSTTPIQFDIPKGTKTKSTNIKFFTMTLTTDNQLQSLDKQITLKAFMCNIGATKPDSSEYMNTGQLQNATSGVY